MNTVPYGWKCRSREPFVNFANDVTFANINFANISRPRISYSKAFISDVLQIMAFRTYSIYISVYAQYIGRYTDHIPRQEVLREICHWGRTKRRRGYICRGNRLTCDSRILHNCILYYHTAGAQEVKLTVYEGGTVPIWCHFYSLRVCEGCNKSY